MKTDLPSMKCGGEIRLECYKKGTLSTGPVTHRKSEAGRREREWTSEPEVYPIRETDIGRGRRKKGLVELNRKFRVG